MTAVKPADVDRLALSPPPGTCLLLFYGPDLGRVAERARLAATTGDGSSGDPFRLIKLAGDDIADQPGRLVEEASSYGLFGSRRTIWVKATARNITPSIAACLELALQDTLVVVEAGDLQRTSPLRALCEKSSLALALPCYADEVRDLGAILTETLRAESLEIDPDARELLTESLGGDRLATRSELVKLVMFVHGRSRITLDDVTAVVSDVSGVSVDDAIDAAFAGDLAELDARLTHLLLHGTAPGTLLYTAARHALSLLGRRAALDEGQTLDVLLRTWRGLHFRRHAAVQRQLRRWPQASLQRAIASLQEASLQVRHSAAMAQTLASRSLFRLASREFSSNLSR